jgi:uncharacterized SAM-binding protein YcdF (DUF218 family)
MKARIMKIGITVLIIILTIGSCRKAGTWLVRVDEAAHADAMVMLMGQFFDRVLQVDDLYAENAAGKVVIVEEAMSSFWMLEQRGVIVERTTQEVREALITLGIPADSIVILTGDATSTRMEAEIIRDYVANQPDIDTILLVSSSSHTRRASMLFEAAFKPLEKHVVIHCSQNLYTGFRAEKWWKRSDDIQDVVLEYMKLVNFMLFEKRQLRNNPS